MGNKKITLIFFKVKTRGCVDKKMVEKYFIVLIFFIKFYKILFFLDI